MKSGLSRRKFLKEGSKIAASIAISPYLLRTNPVQAASIPNKNQADVKDYYKRFGVDEKVIAKIITEGLSNGGDFCDIFFQHRITDSVGLEDNIVNRAYCTVDLGVGIRVLKGDQTGYSFTEEVTKEAMLSAAGTAAAIADSSKKVKPVECKSHNGSSYYPVNIPWESVSIDKKIPVLQKINDRIFSADKRIIKANVFLKNETSYILIANSQGRVTSDYQPMVTIFANCTAEQNGRREQNYHYLSGRYGMEFLNDELIRTVADTAVQRTIALFEAVKAAGGEMALVLAPGTSGILLHEAIGHGMEADFNRKGVSIFSDMIGKPVAEKFVNIIDDGTVENNRGAINIDDEGNDSQRTYLVKDGVLCNYLHDHISAAHYKAAYTGNGRRQSFRFMPQPRMRNTYMLNGPHKHDEIISSVKKGIYAEVFTNGQVDIGAGDFTFYIKSGRLIEDGKLTVPVKDVNVIGNGPKALKKIVMLGDDFQYSAGGGVCRKGGQRVPISYGLPTVKISSITVGGV